MTFLSAEQRNSLYKRRVQILRRYRVKVESVAHPNQVLTDATTCPLLVCIHFTFLSFPLQ